MTPFNINIQTVILLFATLLTGLLAGVFFTWNNAITTGIGRLDDVSYLKAFQQMNRTILNPLFYIVFMGPLILSIAAAYVYKANPAYILWMLISATVIYFLGVVIVTILGNIPLNNMLENTNLADISLEDARNLRDKIETKWNKLHLIRTISSATSFLLLILTCLFRIDSI